MSSNDSGLLWRTAHDLAEKIFGECNMMHCNNRNSNKNASTVKFLRRTELEWIPWYGETAMLLLLLHIEKMLYVQHIRLTSRKSLVRSELLSDVHISRRKQIFLSNSFSTLIRAKQFNFWEERIIVHNCHPFC
jgi:hypothetical protein